MTDTGTGARIFGDRYAIKSKIARGGMADVFLAQDQLLDRPVALKVLFPELSVDPNFVERFRREAQNAAKLSHPNIVSVYDWGEDANTYYIVMEYVNGESLSQTLRNGGPLPAQRAAQIGSEVAAALSFAHRNGVVHRDVKPGNVLLDDRGSVKVTDFGISRARNTTENLTQTGAVMGTATYFSPEQAQGLPVDQRSDVYSLGVVLYEMVAGGAPFTGDNPVTIAYKHVREDPTPLRRMNPSVPGAYESIVAQAMTKSPANRYATAEDLRADLDRFLHGRPVHATGIVPPPNAQRSAKQAYADSTRTIPSAPLPENPRYAQSRQRPPKESKGILVPLMVFISLVALLGIGAVVLFDTSLTFGSSKTVKVPNVLGKQVDDAKATLATFKLQAIIINTPNSADVGKVLNQDPVENASVRKNSSVTLTVSSGPGPITMPDVRGETLATARSTLQKQGLTVTSTQATSDTVQSGKVISTDPPPGDTVPQKGTVTLTVSSGVGQIPIPDVRGYTVQGAIQALTAAGFKANTLPGAQDPDTVTATNPPAGTSVDKNSTVTVVSQSSTTTSNTTDTTTAPTSTPTTPTTSSLLGLNGKGKNGNG